MKNLIIGGLDIETTGLLTPDHRIIEIYIGLWRDGKCIYIYDQRIDPQRAIGIEAQRVHGITAADLVGKPIWSSVAPAIAKILSKCHMVVAHNGLEFDWEFIRQEMTREGYKMPDIPVFDTMLEGIWATPVGKKPRLEELCFACEEEYDHAKAHAASYDVEQMMACFYKGLAWEFFKLPEQLLQTADPASA